MALRGQQACQASNFCLQCRTKTHSRLPLAANCSAVCQPQHRALSFCGTLPSVCACTAVIHLNEGHAMRTSLKRSELYHMFTVDNCMHKCAYCMQNLRIRTDFPPFEVAPVYLVKVYCMHDIHYLALRIRIIIHSHTCDFIVDPWMVRSAAMSRIFQGTLENIKSGLKLEMSPFSSPA